MEFWMSLAPIPTSGNEGSPPAGRPSTTGGGGGDGEVGDGGRGGGDGGGYPKDPYPSA